jgi:hypothetical protein
MANQIADVSTRTQFEKRKKNFSLSFSFLSDFSRKDQSGCETASTLEQRRARWRDCTAKLYTKLVSSV